MHKVSNGKLHPVAPNRMEFAEVRNTTQPGAVLADDFTPERVESKVGAEVGAVAVLKDEVFLVAGEDRGRVLLCCTSKGAIFSVDPDAIRQTRYWASLSEIFPTLFEARRVLKRIGILRGAP